MELEDEIGVTKQFAWLCDMRQIQISQLTPRLGEYFYSYTPGEGMPEIDPIHSRAIASERSRRQVMSTTWEHRSG